MLDAQPHVFSLGPGPAPTPAWIAALNRLGLSLLVFDADGREVHRTAALDALLRKDPAAARRQLLQAATQVARASFKRPRLVRDPSAACSGKHGDMPADIRPVTAGRYRLRAACVDEPAGRETAPGRRMVLVIVEQGSIESMPLPPADRLQEAFGLTCREAEVALMLAHRMRNQEIATALCVSEHTARHHTERVMDKLQIRRRADALQKLQRI